MRELDLDALLKEKREEPTLVSITVVDTWLKGGIAFVGLFATIKWLFTKKMWFMVTSISSISMVTMLAIAQFYSTSEHSEKAVGQVRQERKIAHSSIRPKHSEVVLKSDLHVGSNWELFEVTLLPIDLITLGQEQQQTEPVGNYLPVFKNTNEPKDHFTRIDASGFVHFTLVNGASCSIKNTIPAQEDEAPLSSSIKNGTLYLKSANENNAADLIITVTDLEEIKLNGFCEMITNCTLESTDLEIEVNGFSQLNMDLNAKELEIQMNGETKGALNLKGESLDLVSTGFNDVAIESDFNESRIEVSGFSKIKIVGTSEITLMEISGETKVSAEEFHSQELFLTVSGDNDNLETAVSEKLDVEISGKNNVEILGSPTVLRQEVQQGSKLKIK